MGCLILESIIMISALLVLALAASALAQDLSAVQDSSGQKFWRDRGGFGRKDVTIYEPARSGADFFLLGQRAQGNYNKMERPVHSFRDDSIRRDAINRPVGFRFLWDDQGSTYYDDASVRRMMCPRRYSPMGDVLARKNRVTQPPNELFDKFRCVADDLTLPCDLGTKIWDNKGTNGKYYISMWSSLPRAGQFNSGFYFANNAHDIRPNDVYPRCLKNSSVKLL